MTPDLEASLLHVEKRIREELADVEGDPEVQRRLGEKIDRAFRRQVTYAKWRIEFGGFNMAENDEQVDDINEVEEITPYRYTITSYGADYPVDGIVKRLDTNDILVPAFDPELKDTNGVEGYQRQFIWTKTQCDRFVESLLLGLPVPGIFLVKLDDGRFLVLDGQQRLRTLQAFYKGILRGREFKLDSVQERFMDVTYEDLGADDRRRLDDSIIHATIVKQDEPSDDKSSIYLIFERLNSGGTSLQPQEIRVALHRGPLIQLLREINNNSSWREIYGPKSKRLKDQELILRFFALLYWADKYKRPMKDFLNRYADANRELRLQPKTKFSQVFVDTTKAILESIGPRAFRLKTAINAAVLDSVMVGVATRLETGPPVKNFGDLKTRYNKLLKDADYRSRVERATADEENVAKRLEMSKEAFSKVR